MGCDARGAHHDSADRLGHRGDRLFRAGPLRGKGPWPMQTCQISRALGRLEGTVFAHRREMMGHVMLLHRMARANGHGRKGFPWMQIAAMATSGIASLIGLLKPEAAAAIWVAISKTLWH